MLKSSSFSLIAFIIVLSILGPSIDALMSFGSQTDEAYVIDFNEEENNEGETEKKIDEKECYIEQQLLGTYSFTLQKKSLQEINLLSNSQFDSEIIPPPPKYYV